MQASLWINVYGHRLLSLQTKLRKEAPNVETPPKRIQLQVSKAVCLPPMLVGESGGKGAGFIPSACVRRIRISSSI